MSLSILTLKWKLAVFFKYNKNPAGLNYKNK